jgi:hypothetical protein
MAPVTWRLAAMIWLACATPLAAANQRSTPVPASREHDTKTLVLMGLALLAAGGRSAVEVRRLRRGERRQEGLVVWLILALPETEKGRPPRGLP